MIWKRDWGLVGRQTVAWLVMLAIYAAIIAVAFAFLKGGVLYFILALVFIMAFVQFFFSDKIVLKTMHVQMVDEYSQPKLVAMVRGLAEEAGLPMPKVGVIMHPAMTNIPNAFATGRSPRHAVVAVTPRIMELLNEKELRGVLAHEISHIRNRDMLTMTIGSFAVMIAEVILHNSFFIALFGGMRDSNEGPGVIAYILLIVVTFLIYIIGTMVTMAISRYREFAADRGSGYITQDPDSLISALRKLSDASEHAPQKAKEAVSGLNAFFITPAISGKSVMELFSTHPTLEKRIENLEKVRREIRGY
ncbi:MAG TPA: M48 family metalloprotease [Methanocorpusculum sp.]|nr:M48 family metalloprotease [Methanocorpusculum sp.]